MPAEAAPIIVGLHGGRGSKSRWLKASCQVSRCLSLRPTNIDSQQMCTQSKSLSCRISSNTPRLVSVDAGCFLSWLFMFVLFVSSFARLLLCLLQSRHTYFLYSKQNLMFAIETKPVKPAHACSVTVNATNVFDLPKACKSHLSMHNNKMPNMRQCTICPNCVNAQQQCRTNRHNNVHGTHFLLRIGPYHTGALMKPARTGARPRSHCESHCEKKSNE